MANLMKLCSQCVKWTSEDVTKCPVCGNPLIEARLSSIFWNKISDEEKLEYTKKYLKNTEYIPDDSNKDLHEDAAFRFQGHNGQLYVYPDKLIIERKGLFGMVTNGLAGSKTIPMSSIQNIQFKKASAFFSGFIQFGVLGGIEKQSGITGAISDENSIIFLEECNQQAEEIKEYIENLILSRDRNPSTLQKSDNFSVADEILKLKQLVDMGILTQEEFDAKKKQLADLKF